MMPDGDDEYVIAFQGVHNRVREPWHRSDSNIKGLRMSCPWMIDDELASRLNSVDKADAVAASLTLQVSGGFDELGLSLVVQFA
jgi:hypothetical protein